MRATLSDQPRPLMRDVNGLYFNVWAIETMAVDVDPPTAPGYVLLSIVFTGANDVPRTREDHTLRSYFVITYEQLEWIEENVVGSVPQNRRFHARNVPPERRSA